jgi:hypothetical protein
MLAFLMPADVRRSFKVPLRSLSVRECHPVHRTMQSGSVPSIRLEQTDKVRGIPSDVGVVAWPKASGLVIAGEAMPVFRFLSTLSG